jgi:hypothetical protein
LLANRLQFRNELRRLDYSLTEDCVDLHPRQFLKAYCPIDVARAAEIGLASATAKVANIGRLPMAWVDPWDLS